MRQIRRLIVVIVATCALVAAEAADAYIVKRHDRSGRVITFDVRARGAQVGWYAGILRRAIHGDEIETVRIRILPAARIKTLCGGVAGSCYEGYPDGGVLTIPSARSSETAHFLLHEYAHHIDTARSGSLNLDRIWATSWFAARGLKSMLAKKQVAFDYSLGWEHAVREIFAEDYVQLHMRSRYNIHWLAPPNAAVKAALRRDLR